MTLTQMPKIGDKVRCIALDNEAYEGRVHVGKVYEICEIDRDSDAVFTNDLGYDEQSYIDERFFEYFELVTESHDALQTTYGDQAPATYEIADDTPVEASPTVIDLLTNLSRRVFELEEANKPKPMPNIPTFSPTDLNGKNLRIFTGEYVDDDFKTIVTVGIDDATGVMYVLGMKTEVIE